MLKLKKIISRLPGSTQVFVKSSDVLTHDFSLSFDFQVLIVTIGATNDDEDMICNLYQYIKNADIIKLDCIGKSKISILVNLDTLKFTRSEWEEMIRLAKLLDSRSD